MNSLKLFLAGAMLLLITHACNNPSLRRSSTESNHLSQKHSLPLVPGGSSAAADSMSAEPGITSPEDVAFNTEGYGKIVENEFLSSHDNPLSTFSIDVDEASYSNIRRFINDGMLPPQGAVRIEEMINYFDYGYEAPKGTEPFSIITETAACPWNDQHQLAHVGLKGKEIDAASLPPANLVFLVDVSGSMSEPNKLPLVQSSMNLLVDELREQDRVAIVVYAGAAGEVLPSTAGYEKDKIKQAINALEAGGSTSGGEGIKLAYKIAKKHFIAGGNNRVILATDGDFNVGISSDDALVSLIERERKSNVFLSVLGFGTGNYQDHKMQQLADKGNGNHSYIDDISEAKKVLVKEFGSTLFTIAKDVKIQVEFNPAQVQAYRLIGYENRLLAKEDFNDDKKDAGEMGAGHTVTALYEIIPVGVKDNFVKSVDALKYQKPSAPLNNSNELMTLKLRYKTPEGNNSMLLTKTLMPQQKSFQNSSADFQFAAAVAGFALLLRDSEYKQSATYEKVLNWAQAGKGPDANGYRSSFIEMVKQASKLSGKSS